MNETVDQTPRPFPSFWDGNPYRVVHQFVPGKEYSFRFLAKGEPVRLRLSYVAGDRGNARYTVKYNLMGEEPVQLGGAAKSFSHLFQNLTVGGDYKVTITVSLPTTTWMQINA